MTEINIREVDGGGYIYKITGINKNGGEHVCKATEEFKMLERIGEAIMGYKIKVERR